MEGSKQEMPPPGGFAPIIYQRIPLKAGLDPKLKLFLFTVCSGLGIMWFRSAKWEVTKNRLEDWSAHSALMPMVLAETDRMVLKQLRRNRDAEERVMKDVEGWEVGTWRGIPVYKSFGRDEYFRPSLLEYFMHSDDSEMYKHRRVFLYN